MEDQKKQIEALLANMQQLEQRVQELQDIVERNEKQQIKLVGNWDGNTAPVTVQGRRCSITATAL